MSRIAIDFHRSLRATLYRVRSSPFVPSSSIALWEQAFPPLFVFNHAYPLALALFAWRIVMGCYNLFCSILHLFCISVGCERDPREERHDTAIQGRLQPSRLTERTSSTARPAASHSPPAPFPSSANTPIAPKA